ncbi:ABC transporter ATP-binding protein [Streptosporangium sp. NBC_01755]|uniref:ABC transporter ATP-binding protein n=1 Tax=Streptosporangium sp. NBC_01755 TaxID=2975949 RepID=UPI002DD86435|nr:ABC transporter ATP-binding protein [Streptosporangium sp. NBC_01755]WSC99774.1 ABC transporter ATP-binding protein [Streptosporangium sp. NBC_01755]
MSLTIRRGETLGLVGESGSGKSTLGRALIGLQPATSGEIVFDGVSMTTAPRGERRDARRRMQMVFQDPYASLNPRMQLEAIVSEPIVAHRLATGGEVRSRVRDLLRQVGLDPDWSKRFPRELSGGQQQRVAIARALASEPDFIVCDEPTSALDVSVQAQMLHLLKSMREQRTLTYLFVSHNLAVVRRMSHRIAVMYAGTLVEIGSRDEFFASPLHPYTRRLLAAVPGNHQQIDPELTHAPGPLPAPGETPDTNSCPFWSRCPLYEQLGAPERCRTEKPELGAIDAGHAVACHFVEAAALQTQGEVR